MGRGRERSGAFTLVGFLLAGATRPRPMNRQTAALQKQERGREDTSDPRVERDVESGWLFAGGWAIYFQSLSSGR